MEKKKKIIIWPFVVIVLLGIIVFCVHKFKNKTTYVSNDSLTESTVVKTDIINSLSSSSYVTSALTENKELHTTYYFEEIYYEKNQYISAGENILKYTNGKYLVAPYNCVITDWSLPEKNEICTNKHYITIQSTDTLKISLQIDEDELDTIYVGQEASIEIEALDNKSVTGYVTKIENTATYSSSGSSFGVDVELKNDGDILIGMTSKCSIILQKSENAIAVATEAITNKNGKKYVNVKKDNGQVEETEIETGIKNDAYTEVKSGLNEGDIVVIENEETGKSKMNGRNNNRDEKDDNKEKPDFSEKQMQGEEPPQIPNK